MLTPNRAALSLGAMRRTGLPAILIASIAVGCRAEPGGAPDAGSPPVAASAPPPAVPEPTPAAPPRPGKREQCDRLIGTVNADAKRLAAASAERRGDDAGSILAVADALDRIAADLRRLDVDIDELASFRDRYAKLASEAASAARDAGVAADRHESAKVAEAERAMDRVVREGGPMVEAVNRFCRGSPGAKPVQSGNAVQQPVRQ